MYRQADELKMEKPNQPKPSWAANWATAASTTSSLPLILLFKLRVEGESGAARQAGKEGKQEAGFDALLNQY